MRGWAAAPTTPPGRWPGWALRPGDQLKLLRGDPGLVQNAVEELLRYLAIVQISPPRRAT
jgi:cytochrome P450